MTKKEREKLIQAIQHFNDDCFFEGLKILCDLAKVRYKEEPEIKPLDIRVIAKQKENQ